MGHRKCYFLFLSFSFFQISNDYCQKSIKKSILFYNGFLMNFYYVRNIFDQPIFNNETTLLLKFFEIYTETYFVSSFFLNERIITKSLQMIHLTCTVMHYSNLNSTFISKPFLVCFSISYLRFILTRLLSKTLRKNYHFLIQI